MRCRGGLSVGDEAVYHIEHLRLGARDLPARADLDAGV